MKTCSSVWSCPVCYAPLRMREKQLACPLNHNFDYAKQGYVNLLLANQKRSREPGDGPQMITSRRTFLSSGHYDFLIDYLKSEILKRVSNSLIEVLDIGCGEGYYLNKIYRDLNRQGLRYWGIDISKVAIRQASSLLKAAQFAVASSHQIPVVGDSIDIALSIFAPFSPGELSRILKSGGVWVRVSPGEMHLWQLKQAIYNSPKPHAAPKSIPGSLIRSERRVNKKVNLNRHDLHALIGMSPLRWRGDKLGVISVDTFEIDFDFYVQVIAFA